MYPVNELVVGIHLLLLLAFLGVTTMLLLVTVVNRARLHEVILSWPCGRFFGLPVWSTLFLAFVLGFILVTVMQDQIVFPVVFVGYLMGGAFWFASSVVMSTMHVTPSGIVRNVNRDGESITWLQVTDYFEVDATCERCFIFLYTDGSGSRGRFEVFVPSAYYGRFKRLVEMQLDGRFDLSETEFAGPHALED